MKILLVKTSSLGDIIHALPAVSDLAKALPDSEIDWVIEPAFQAIPRLSQYINEVIPFPIREFRKKIFSAITGGELFKHVSRLRKQQSDLVIDAQGLFKSGIVTALAKGRTKVGLDMKSLREPIARFFYHQGFYIPKEEHAIKRLRILFSKVFQYTYDEHVLDYGFLLPEIEIKPKPYIILLHATTWASKRWPLLYWQRLASMISQKGYDIKIPWGNDEERVFADQISQGLLNAHVLSSKLNLKQIAILLRGATGIVGVDTGLCHLAQALDVPLIALYSATDPSKTGVFGDRLISLQTNYRCSPCLRRVCIYHGNYPIHPPCFSELPPDKVWRALEKLIESNNRGKNFESSTVKH